MKKMFFSTLFLTFFVLSSNKAGTPNISEITNNDIAPQPI